MPKFKMLKEFKPPKLYAFKPSFETFMGDILLRYNWGKDSEGRIKRVDVEDVKFHNRLRYGVLENIYNRTEDLEEFTAKSMSMINDIINDTYDSLIEDEWNAIADRTR